MKISLAMVSQEFSRESTPIVLHQCLTSNMDTCPVHSEDLCYGLQFQSNSVPLCFQPLGEQIYRSEDNEMATRCLMNRESQKENSCQGFSYGHGLSLTLGSRLPSDVQKDRQANVMCSNHLSNESNDYMICEGETNNSVYTSNYSNPTLHGMASIVTVLQNSPYMKPAQQLLDEVVCVSNAVEPGSDKQAGSIGRAMMSAGRSLRVGERTNRHQGNHYLSEEKHEVQIRITKLVALLDELENRYDHYFHQMDRVVSSFEVVAGIGAAASYTALTIQAMSKHFSNLRDAIITQLNALRDSLSEDSPRNHGRLSHQKLLNLKKRETLQHLGMVQIQQVWRPLRGLPEDSVALLRAWLFEHFLHPYPSDNEKLMLASQTGLTRNQISNWFINARVRLWKPMIEEMYREEFAEDLQD